MQFTVFKGHKTFWGLSSFEMLAMFRRGLFYSYLSIYLRHFLGLSVTETTLFATLPMIANVVFQTFVWGGISDRYQVRRLLIIYGEALAGVGTVLVWYAHTLAGGPTAAGYVIIVGLTLIEIFWSMSNVGWSALISDIYREHDRNAVQGRLASIGGVGRMAGVWIGGLLYDGLGRYYEGWGFQQGALFFVAAAVMVLSIGPILLAPEGGIAASDSGPTGAERDGAGASAGVFLVFLAAMALINFGRNSIALILPQYLVLDSGLDVSSRTLSYIVNTQSAAMIITGLLSGWFGRRLGNGRSLLLATFLAIAALTLLSLSMNLKLIYAISFARGFSEVIILAASYAFASILIPPRKRGRYFGMFNATFFLSWGIAGTLMAGPVADAFIAGGAAEVFAYQMAFASAGAMTLAGGLILMVLLGALARRGAAN
jgi:MFS family permease